jgi:hypothetical protein
MASFRQMNQHVAGISSIFLKLRGVRHGRNVSFRRDPQPQAISHDGHGANPAKPKGNEPHQSLRQWRRLLRLGPQ